MCRPVTPWRRREASADRDMEAADRLSAQSRRCRRKRLGCRHPHRPRLAGVSRRDRRPEARASHPGDTLSSRTYCSNTSRSTKGIASRRVNGAVENDLDPAGQASFGLARSRTRKTAARLETMIDIDRRGVIVAPADEVTAHGPHCWRRRPPGVEVQWVGWLAVRPGRGDHDEGQQQHAGSVPDGLMGSASRAHNHSCPTARGRRGHDRQAPASRPNSLRPVGRCSSRDLGQGNTRVQQRQQKDTARPDGAPPLPADSGNVPGFRHHQSRTWAGSG